MLVKSICLSFLLLLFLACANSSKRTTVSSLLKLRIQPDSFEVEVDSLFDSGRLGISEDELIAPTEVSSIRGPNGQNRLLICDPGAHKVLYLDDSLTFLFSQHFNHIITPSSACEISNNSLIIFDEFSRKIFKQPRSTQTNVPSLALESSSNIRLRSDRRLSFLIVTPLDKQILLINSNGRQVMSYTQFSGRFFGLPVDARFEQDNILFLDKERHFFGKLTRNGALITGLNHENISKTDFIIQTDFGYMLVGVSGDLLFINNQFELLGQRRISSGFISGASLAGNKIALLSKKMRRLSLYRTTLIRKH